MLAPRRTTARQSLLERLAAQLRWRLNRIRCMTVAEIPYRVGRAIRARAERYGVGDIVASPAPDLLIPERRWIDRGPNVDPQCYRAAADRLVAGRFDVFSLHDVQLGTPPAWNRDPKSGQTAPLTFGKLLDYRNPALVGDIKYLWEPNRHAHLVTLAQAYALHGDARFVDTIRLHLESWWSSCPFRMGPNWSSTLEVAIRLINWAAAWQLVGGAQSPVFDGREGARFRQQWLHSVYQHARFILGHFSLYSSANNHLIGEAAGLFVAAHTWPFWPETDSWSDAASTILERETLAQNAPEAVNREQAVSYQQFELDLLLLAMLAGRVAGHSFSTAFESRVAAMAEFLASLMDKHGNLPMIGDADDGMVVDMSREERFCRYRSVLATAALAFRRGDLCATAGALDDKTRWLFGPGADDAFRGLRISGSGRVSRRAFPDGGYFVIGNDFDTCKEIRMIVDAGPLGYNTIAAHGHADALAFTLTVGGQEIFVDPGTYSYLANSRWRAYFRGTAAHNTLRVDGEDQSEPGGNFMWIRKAHTHRRVWRSSPESDVLECWHDGYQRLPDPVEHGRRITMDKSTRRIVIEDILRMSGVHDVELFFHCSEHCFVETIHGGFRVHCGDAAIDLQLPEAPDALSQIHYGDAAPIRGWISRRFGEKQPSPTIAWQARMYGDCVLRSELRC